MGKIYINQTKVDLYVECRFDSASVNMSNVISCKLHLVPPGGTAIVVDASLEPDGKTVSYKPTTNVFTKAGLWKIYPYLTFDDGREAPGEPSLLTIWKL